MIAENMASGLLLSEMGDVEQGTSEASLLLDGVALRCGPDEGGLFPDKPAGPSCSGLWLGLLRLSLSRQPFKSSVQRFQKKFKKKAILWVLFAQ